MVISTFVGRFPRVPQACDKHGGASAWAVDGSAEWWDETTPVGLVGGVDASSARSVSLEENRTARVFYDLEESGKLRTSRPNPLNEQTLLGSTATLFLGVMCSKYVFDTCM